MLASDDPDEDWVRRAQAGDRNALSELVRRHQDLVYRHLSRMLGSHDDALGLAQVIRLLEASLKLDSPPGHPEPAVRQNGNAATNAIIQCTRANMTETAIQAALSSPYRVQDPELAGRVAAVDGIIRPRQQIIYAKQLAMENSMKPIRHSLVAASILAAFLVPAAPAAFALGAGTTYRGIYTEAGGTPDAPAASYSLEIMQRTVASQSVTPDTGTTYRGIYTEARGTPDAPAASYSLEVMQKKIVPSSSPITLELRGVPAY